MEEENRHSSSSSIAETSSSVITTYSSEIATVSSVVLQESSFQDTLVTANSSHARTNVNMNKCKNVRVITGDVIVNPRSRSPIQSILGDFASTSSSQKCNLWRFFCDRRMLLAIILICIITTGILSYLLFFILTRDDGSNKNPFGVDSSTVHTSTEVPDPSDEPQTSIETTDTVVPTTPVFTPPLTSDRPQTSTTPTPTTPTTTKPTIIKSRRDWGAAPPKSKSEELSGIVRRIIIAHTLSDSCNIECAQKVRQIQVENSHLNDIPYNYLIGDDGFVYEGRGERLQGEHTSTLNGSSYNEIGICVAFIGTFEEMPPSDTQLETFQNFIETFVNRGIIDSDYKIFSQDQLKKMKETEALRTAVKYLNENVFHDGNR